MASILLMTWHSCHTSTTRCRTRPLSWRPHQQEQGSRSTGKRPSWWIWTQQPTHQSHLVESPSGGVFRLPGKCGWPTLRIFKARAAFVMHKNIWTSGGFSVRTKLLMSSSSSTPMWSQSCSTDVRHGGQHRRCNKRSRHFSTPILDAFTKSNGKGRSEMKICGSERDWNCCRDCLYRIDWLNRSRLFQKTIDSCIGFSTHLTTCVVAVDLESNRRFLIRQRTWHIETTCRPSRGIRYCFLFIP